MAEVTIHRADIFITVEIEEEVLVIVAALVFGSHHSSHYGPTYYYGSGGGSIIGIVAIWIAVVFIVIASLLPVMVGGITKSTHEREKLSSADCKMIDTWYIDDIDWIHNEKTLVNGLKDFYSKTGGTAVIVHY